MTAISFLAEDFCPAANSFISISHLPIHENPLSRSSSKAIGSPSGARLDLIGSIYRFEGSSLSLATNNTLLAAAAISILPSPLYMFFPPLVLFICPTKTIAQAYSDAMFANFVIVSLILTTLCIFPFFPIKACIGSSTSSLAPVIFTASSIRSSSSVKSPSSSLINATLRQSAPALSSLGFIVSPLLSSEHW